MSKDCRSAPAAALRRNIISRPTVSTSSTSRSRSQEALAATFLPDLVVAIQTPLHPDDRREEVYTASLGGHEDEEAVDRIQTRQLLRFKTALPGSAFRSKPGSTRSPRVSWHAPLPSPIASWITSAPAKARTTSRSWSRSRLRTAEPGWTARCAEPRQDFFVLPVPPRRNRSRVPTNPVQLSRQAFRASGD